MTEHAGRAHRIDERPVAAPVPRQHGAPPFVVVHGQGCRLGHGAHGTPAGGEIYPKLALELVKGGGIGLGADAVMGANCHERKLGVCIIRECSIIWHDGLRDKLTLVIK